VIPRRLVIALAAIWFFAPAPVGADAVFVAASPASRSTVGGDVDELQIVFNEVVTGAVVSLEGPDGAIALADAVDEGQVITARFEPLSSEGRYVVRYAVISADTDPVDGAYEFTYRADGPPPLPASVPAIQSGGRSLTGALVGVAAVAVVAAAVQLISRTRRLRKLQSVNGGVPSDT